MFMLRQRIMGDVVEHHIHPGAGRGYRGGVADIGLN